MPVLHVANTHFEWELLSGIKIEPLLRPEPLFLQLQFLPCLYAGKEDKILVTHWPSTEYFEELSRWGIPMPQFCLLSEACWDRTALRGFSLSTWGDSQGASFFGEDMDLKYSPPSWKVTMEVNSKHFSFLHEKAHGRHLPGATLLDNRKEAFEWVGRQKGPFVLKTCLGVSGRGHLLVKNLSPERLKAVDSFLHGEWLGGRPVIGEPWVTRLLDFSTQWYLSSGEISYLGATVCENDSKGRYRGTQVGKEEELFGSYLPYVTKQRESAYPLLERIAEKCYTGHVGIDAMVYLSREDASPQLQAVVEVNARKTMGWLALEMQRLYFPEKRLTLSFSQKADLTGSLLPWAAFDQEGTRTSFSRGLFLSFL